GISLTRRLIGTQPRRLEAVAGECQTPGPLPYERASDLLPGPVRREFVTLAANLDGRPLRVVVEPAEGLHGPCWEALAALTLGRRRPDDQPFRFERTVVERRSTTVRSSSGSAIDSSLQILGWATDTLARTVFTRGWAKFPKDRGSVSLASGD